MARLPADELIAEVAAAHARERALIEPLSEAQVRAASALPGWTRGHVLAARRAFLRAAGRQVEVARAGRRVEFYDGDRAGRDVEIAAHADRPGAELVAEVVREAAALDRRWAGLAPGDLDRPVDFRGGGTLLDVCLAAWREAELHAVDLDLGVRVASWSAPFCLALFDFLAPRVPDGTRVELATPDGGTWSLGAGEPVRVTGALPDLAAWLAGRPADGPVVSSSGVLPPLRRLREAAQRAATD